MDFLRPASWEEALAAKAEHPSAVPIAGGTDVMVEINFDHRRPDVPARPQPHRRAAASGRSATDDRAAGRLRPVHPDHGGPARPSCRASPSPATRSASPQIRNRGGVGGNLGTASPAGDAHPALLAGGGEVEAESVRGTRLIPIDDFYLGVKRNALRARRADPGRPHPGADGPQQFSKVGTRNAMVIAVCAFGLALHPATRTVRTGIGSAAPTPRPGHGPPRSSSPPRSTEGGLWDSGRPIPPAVAGEFAELVAAAANPIDDVRGTRRLPPPRAGRDGPPDPGWTWNEYRSAERSAAACA